MSDSAQGTLGPINWGSNVVNGQLVPQPPSSAFFPLFMGAQYVNPKWATGQPYNVPPVIPSPAMAIGNEGGVTSTPVAPTQAGAAQNSKTAWHPTKGTLFFGFFALVAGLFMLHYIHYGGGKKK